MPSGSASLPMNLHQIISTILALPGSHVRTMATLALAVVPGLGAVSGCDNKSCDGIEFDGRCEPVCRDSECGEDERCVENRCSPECSKNSECPGGACRSVTADYGGRGNYCLYDERPNLTPDAGLETDASGPSSQSCEDSSDCYDPTRQMNCVGGECVVACLLHAHCTGAGACTGSGRDAAGQSVSYCEVDSFPRDPGQFGWVCLDGNNDCDLDADFRCLTQGEGDLDGYCSKLGCDGDSQCPTGYYCNIDVFGSLSPCEDACGLPGNPSDVNCVDLADIGAGRPFRCGDNGQLELRSCRRRTFCSPCDSDADCRGQANQLCARDASGQKICTKICDPLGTSCPWGSATTCDVFDAELGVPTCGHRSGSCGGTGASCDPCIDDSDCPGGFCTSSSFTGEQFCANLGDTCSCSAGEGFCFGGGCPNTPGGLVMNCVPTSDGAPPSVCFGASIVPGDETAQLGCWPE